MRLSEWALRLLLQQKRDVMNQTSKEMKQALRHEVLARRDALDPQWRVEASLGFAKWADRIAPEPGAIVSGFWSMRSEVDVRPLMTALRERGARLALPAILSKTEMIFRELVPGAPLVDMGFETYRPGEDAAIVDPVVMLVPLVAYDRRGHRIGYGAGYYDRAIELLEKKGVAPRLIGIAFDCQQVEYVPDEPHDVPLPEILTESGLRPFPLSS